MAEEILPNLVTPLMVEIGPAAHLLDRHHRGTVLPRVRAFSRPAPNWGIMINENRIGLTENPWAVVVPAALIAVLTVGVNTLTDAIARVALGVDRGEAVTGHRSRCVDGRDRMIVAASEASTARVQVDGLTVSAEGSGAPVVDERVTRGRGRRGPRTRG